VVAFGTCASCGGFYDNYATIPGIDKVIPVDVYVPGCPPRPEAVLDGLMLLQEKISSGDKGPRIVPPRELPRLTQLKKKTSTVLMAIEEEKRLEAEKDREKASALLAAHDDDDDHRVPVPRSDKSGH
jgi:NADH-quinone oxidoreductase subunit B